MRVYVHGSNLHAHVPEADHVRIIGRWSTRRDHAGPTSFGSVEWDHYAAWLHSVRDDGRLKIANFEGGDFAFTGRKDREQQREAWADFARFTRRVLGPANEFGIYRIVPERSFYDPVSDGRRQFDWKWRNNRLRDIADEVDVICPSIYLFRANVPGNQHPTGGGSEHAQREYVAENLDEALQYGKPVIPYVWGYLHSDPGPLTDWQINMLADEIGKRPIDRCVCFHGQRAEGPAPNLKLIDRLRSL